MTWRAVPAEFKTGMCEMKSRGLRFCGGFLGTLVRRFAEMHAVTCKTVPAEFKTGMCEMKSWGLRFCGVFLGTLVRDRCGKMRAVTWRAVPVNEAVERDEVLGVKG